jgi:acetyltransferase-like isoleucine patch superfamily enzyme
MYHSVRLFLCRTPAKRAAYLKKHDILGAIGDNCKWGPWLLPLYPKLIRLGNNVHVHKTAVISTHDMLNKFLKTRNPDVDFGHGEKLGCVELMDNVYISMNVTIMPDVRINRDCIISAGSVVSSDIPENSVASGIPAQPVGRFDMFMALRRMSKGQRAKFRNQELDDAIADAEWERFLRRRNKQ